MALTKIVKGMLADGSVQPSNLITTGSYTVGNITVNGNARITGALTATNFTATIATVTNLTLQGQISLVNTGSFRVGPLRESTSTEIAYYNPTTREMSYGSLSAITNPFDQVLNTASNVSFRTVTVAQTGTFRVVTASTGSFNQVNIFNYRLPTADGTANQVMTTNGAGVISFRTLADQLVFTTSTVRFAGLTATTATISALTATNITAVNLDLTSKITVTSPNGFKVDTLDSATSDYVTYYNPSTKELTYGGLPAQPNPFNQELNTYDNVQFPVTWIGTVTSLTTSSLISGGYQLDIGFGWPYPIAGGVIADNPVSGTRVRIGGAEVYLTGDVTIQSELRPAFSRAQLGTSENRFNLVADTSTFYSTATFLGPVTISGTTTATNIIPNAHITHNLGSSTRRWARGWINTLTVGLNTIYFENEEGGASSTLGISTGTVYVDGTAYVDQPLTQTSTPTFASVNATDVTFDNLTASTATFTNLTVIGTMTVLNVTTENVTTENIVTQNFADGTTQTTAWTGTVANSQITSVSTSKVTGLSVVGWTNQYGDLTGKPNQDLNTSSTVTFAHVRTANTLTFAGSVARMAGVRLASFVTPGVSSNILFYNTTTGETGWFPGPNQQLNTSSVVTFAGVTTTNITVRGNIVFNDATTQGTTGQTSVYARNALPSGTIGRIITISDSGSDTNSPAGNYAPAYWDPDASVWTYIGNSNSVTPN